MIWETDQSWSDLAPMNGDNQGRKRHPKERIRDQGILRTCSRYSLVACSCRCREVREQYVGSLKWMSHLYRKESVGWFHLKLLWEGQQISLGIQILGYAFGFRLLEADRF